MAILTVMENSSFRCSSESRRTLSVGKFGFTDHSSHFVISPQYHNAWDFKNGFAQVTVGKGNHVKNGYIDKTGKVIWQPSS